MHNLRSAKGARTKVKRVGRGNGSGKGTTAGRGTKGQAARTGGRGGRKLRGIRKIMLSTPKLRGKRNKSLNGKLATVTLGALDSAYQAGETVTPENLERKGLIASSAAGVKVLGGGTLKKKLIVVNCTASEAAKALIAEAGGEFRA
jgi:large subunit ribosomal protein L15